jgi:hypothetical protein
MKVQCYPVFNDILELAINDEDSEQPSTSHTRLTRSELFTLRDKLTALCADMKSSVCGCMYLPQSELSDLS